MCFRNITDENQFKVADYLCSMNLKNELDFFLDNVIDRHNVQRRDPTKCENYTETLHLSTICLLETDM